jgi:hypothetical protein
MIQLEVFEVVCVRDVFEWLCARAVEMHDSPTTYHMAVKDAAAFMLSVFES